MVEKKPRVGIIDEIRGICIILVVLFHLLYDIDYFVGLSGNGFLAKTFNMLEIFQPLYAGALVFISGISSRFSHSNLRRGLLVYLLGLGISVITAIASPDNRIRFGILGFLGSCMIIHWIVEQIRPEGKKYSSSSRQALFFAFMGIILFLVTFLVPHGYIGFFKTPIFKLPDVLYQTSFLYPLGFPQPTFYSSDYFALIPWGFLFAAGSLCGIYVRDSRLPDFFYKTHSKLLSFIGQHTLVIYLVHQPVLFGLFYLVLQS